MWWVCLVALVARGAAAEEDQGQCKVLDLSLQPSDYPLPTNLSVRPSIPGWWLNFTLRAGQVLAVACVSLKEDAGVVGLGMFGGHCDEGNILDYSYLPRGSVSPRAWTSLAVNVTADTLLVTAPGVVSVPLKSRNVTLPRDGLRVMGGQGVEAAVGCRGGCPVHHHASEGPDVEKKVGEWQQDTIHFHFRPGSSFSRLHYELVCKTRHGAVFRRGVEIKPEGEAAGGWQLVKLEQQERKATVRLNGRPLQDIQLPVSCTSSMHVIWAVGDGSFDFSCDPRAVVEQEEEEEEEEGVQEVKEEEAQEEEEEEKEEEVNDNKEVEKAYLTSFIYYICIGLVVAAIVFIGNNIFMNTYFNTNINRHTAAACTDAT